MTLQAFADSEEFNQLQALLSKISQKYGLDLTKEVLPKGVPVTVFATKNPPLAALATYLHGQGDTPSIIARKLRRSVKTIYQSLNNAKPFKPAPTTLYVPEEIFANRAYSVMENLTRHLHEQLTFSQIARLIKKDPRTVWTWWHRSQTKH